MARKKSKLFWILMPMYMAMAAHIMGGQVDSRPKRHRDFCVFGTRQADTRLREVIRRKSWSHFPFLKDTDGELTQSELSGVVQLAWWYGEMVKSLYKKLGRSGMWAIRDVYETLWYLRQAMDSALKQQVKVQMICV